ncbi:MAG: hypothetical protein RL518_351 [Pseudomonadota bacterium]|jgi:hypothetical protein
MREPQKPSVTIQGVTVERQDIIQHLRLPASFVGRGNQLGDGTIPSLIQEHPSELRRIGLYQKDVYAPYCTNVEEGTWAIKTHKVWFDEHRGRPLDEETITILESLPLSLSSSPRRELLEYLPPTYCKNREDAALLVDLLQKAGPTHLWRQNR